MAVDVTNDLKMIIDGVAVASTSGRWIEVRSPATGELVGRVPDGTEADVDRAVAVARAAFKDGRWHRMAMPDRVAIMNRLGDLLDRDADELARLETLQTGHVLQAPARVRLRVRERQPALLRDADPEPRGQGRLRVQRQPHELRPARADRRGRPGQPVELPDVDGDLEDRSGAGGRQLDRPQARERDAADDDPPRRAGAGGRRPGRGVQRRHGSRRRRRVRRSRPTWTWTSSR